MKSFSVSGSPEYIADEIAKHFEIAEFSNKRTYTMHYVNIIKDDAKNTFTGVVLYD